MANGTDLIKQAALIELGDYACFFRFRDRVKPYFNKVPYNKAEVIKKINEYVRRFSKPKGKIDQEKAVKILIAEDLKRIKKIILKKKFQKPDDLLEKQIKQIKRIFRKYKLAKDLPEPHLVSKFPKPFQKMDWNCCFCDYDDEKESKIRTEIYIKKQWIELVVSAGNLMHEDVHLVVSQNTPHKKNLTARGLEDGLCDLLGRLIFMSELVGKKSAKTSLIYSLYYTPKKYDHLAYLYIENFNQACLVYKYYGLKGVLDLIGGGREKIKKAEKLCLQGKYNELDIKKGNFDPGLIKIIDLALTYPKHLVVSPLAYYFATVAKEGMTVNQIAEKYNIKKEIARKAAKELQEKLFVLVIDDKREIDCNLSKLYIKTRSLRYDTNKR